MAWKSRPTHVRSPAPVSSCRDVEAHNPHKYTEMQDMGSAADGDEKDSSSFDGYRWASAHTLWLGSPHRESLRCVRRATAEAKGLAKTYRYRFWKWTFWFTHDAVVWRRLLMIILAVLGTPPGPLCFAFSVLSGVTSLHLHGEPSAT